MFYVPEKDQWEYRDKRDKLLFCVSGEVPKKVRTDTEYEYLYGLLGIQALN